MLVIVIHVRLKQHDIAVILSQTLLFVGQMHSWASAGDGERCHLALDMQ